MGYRLYARIHGSEESKRWSHCFGKLFGYRSRNEARKSAAYKFLKANSTFLIENFTDGAEDEEVFDMFESDFNFTAEMSRLDFMIFIALYCKEWEGHNEGKCPDHIMNTAVNLVMEPVRIEEEDCVILEWSLNMNMSCITCYYGKIEEGKLSCKDRHESLEGLNYEELCRLASECAKYRFYADGERE